MALHHFIPQARYGGSAAAFLILLLGLLSLVLTPAAEDPWLTPWVRISVLALGACLLATVAHARHLATLLAIVTLVSGAFGLGEYVERTAWPTGALEATLLGVIAAAVPAAAITALLLAWWKSARKRSVAVLSIAAAIFLLAMVALFVDMQRGMPTGSADPVVVIGRMLLLVTIATALAALSGRRAARGETGQRWLVIPVVLVVATTTLTLSFFLRMQEIEAAEEATQSAVDRLEEHTRSMLANSVVGIDRMASRWTWQGQPDRLAWSADASLFVHDYNEVSAIAWLDADYAVRWLVPYPGAQSLAEFEFAIDADVRRVLDHAGETRATVATGPTALSGGDAGVQIHVPIVTGLGIDGFMTGFYHIAGLFDGIVEAVTPGYVIEVAVASEVVYRSGGEISPAARLRGAQRSFDIYGMDWEARAFPDPATLSRMLSWLPGIILVFGMILAVLLGMAVHQAEANRIAVRRLAREVRRRSRTERELRGHQRELEHRVHERTADLARNQEQLEAINARLEHQATTDELTGLWNRRHFLEVADQHFRTACRYDRVLALTLFDLDHFKTINDDHGHQVGDAALRHVATVVREALRDIDCLARFGGEEFVILLPEADLDAAARVAERVRASIEARPFECASQHHYLSASFGVAARSPGDHDIGQLIQRADHALYAAKNDGRNRVRTMVANPAAGR